MNKNDVKTIIITAGIIALIGALFYFGGGNETVDTGQNVSPVSLNTLVGKQAPVFSFADRGGNEYSSDNLRGKNVIFFFNEGLMCYPACWNQIVSLAEDDRFKANDIAVLSVVVDSKEDWQRAVDKMPELAEALVVFDDGAAVSKKFGVLSAPSSMHPGSFPGHTYVLINTEGVVRYVFDDPSMGIRNDQLWAEVTKLITNK